MNGGGGGRRKCRPPHYPTGSGADMWDPKGESGKAGRKAANLGSGLQDRLGQTSGGGATIAKGRTSLLWKNSLGLE